MITRRLLLRTVVPVAGLAVVGASVLVLINSSGPGGHTSMAPHRAPAVPMTVEPSTVASPPPLPAPPPAVWRVAWASTMAWGYGTAAQATIRELTTVAIGGQAVRVRISNLFGTRPLVLGAGTVAASTGAGATIDTATLLPLAFNGSANVTVPTGAVIYTEPVPIAVHAGETLAVSLFVTSPDLITVHPCCAGPLVSYFTPNGAGNATEVASGGVFAYSSTWERLVDAIDVLQAHGNGSIVVLGDSISDGYRSALRWTDVLQQRIDQLPSAQRRAVVNEAITANTLTDPPRSDATTGGGPAGLDRLDRDALDQAGVSEVILFLGTNDLYFGAPSAQVIAGMQQVVAATHAAGMRIVGVTLLPRQTSVTETWTPQQQTHLEQVNDWMLHSGGFDGIVNLASVVSDMYDGACEPTAMFDLYDSGDHLHPDAAGETAMADAIDTTTLGLPPAPLVSPVPTVTPTAGCSGVLGIPPPSGPGRPALAPTPPG